MKIPHGFYTGLVAGLAAGALAAAAVITALPSAPCARSAETIELEQRLLNEARQREQARELEKRFWSNDGRQPLPTPEFKERGL
jgi:hypothetical protein